VGARVRDRGGRATPHQATATSRDEREGLPVALIPAERWAFIAPRES